MSNATSQYVEVAAQTFPAPEPQPARTASGMFDVVKPHLSPRPLRRPARTRLCREEIDRIDAAAAKAAMEESGTVSLDDLERELGL